MSKRARRIRTKAEHLPEISLTPLIDTVLVLLVIFMVCVPVVQQAIKVNLPQGQSTEKMAGQQNDVFVYLDKHKKMYVNKTAVSDDTLVAEVKKRMHNPQEQFVFINADGSLAYEDVISGLIGKLKKGGITRVALSTRSAPTAA